MHVNLSISAFSEFCQLTLLLLKIVIFLGIPEGGLVPKSLYMTPQEFEKDQSPGPHLMDNSCYQSIALTKGQVKLNLRLCKNCLIGYI